MENPKEIFISEFPPSGGEELNMISQSQLFFSFYWENSICIPIPLSTGATKYPVHTGLD